MLRLPPILFIFFIFATCHFSSGQTTCVPTKFKTTAILKNWQEAANNLECNLSEKNTYPKVDVLVDSSGNSLKIRLRGEGDGFLIPPLTQVMPNLKFTPAVDLEGKKAASWYPLALYITGEGCLELEKNDDDWDLTFQPVPVNMREITQAVGYPDKAVSAGLEGTVVIRVLTNSATGEVIRYKTIYSDGEIFEKPILREISNLRFKSVEQGPDVPSKYWVNIPFNFKLPPYPEEKKIKVALEKARALAAEGAWAEALVKYQKLTEARPEDYVFWVEKGYCQYKLKDVNNARLSFAFAETNLPRFTNGPTLRTVFFPVYLAYRNDCTSPLVPAMYSLLRSYNLIDAFDFWVGMPSYED